MDDGTYIYTYDDEGNRVSREHDNGEVTDYEWDYRNRLVQVVTWTNDERTTSTQIVAFRYDAFNRRIAKLVDADGDEDFDTEQHFVYDGDHIVLVFNGAGSLTNRFLPGPAVDQIMADENVSQLITDPARVRWPLPDNLGTPRDLVDSDGDVLNHIDYDAFGNRVAETNDAIDHLFGFTGRDWDEETGLQYNRNRYYDPAVGRWISEDPIGFAAGDPNLNRYVENSAVNATDPNGLVYYSFALGRWILSLDDPSLTLEERRILGEEMNGNLLGLASPLSMSRGIGSRLLAQVAGKFRVRGAQTLATLGLKNTDLCGKSYNAGRKLLEQAGFVLDRTTARGRKVFINPKTGAEAVYDSGRALLKKQKPHWHIKDKAGQSFNRTGRPVDPSEGGAHIPAR